MLKHASSGEYNSRGSTEESSDSSMHQSENESNDKPRIMGDGSIMGNIFWI